MNIYLTHINAFTAGLKTISGQKDKKNMANGNDGGGSLSSGSSIVTITSVAASDPDPDYPNGSNENKKDIRNEKWYYTILQVSVPFFIAGMGTIGAGRVLTGAKVNLAPIKAQNQVFIKRSIVMGGSIKIDFIFIYQIGCTLSIVERGVALVCTYVL